MQGISEKKGIITCCLHQNHSVLGSDEDEREDDDEDGKDIEETKSPWWGGVGFLGGWDVAEWGDQGQG